MFVLLETNYFYVKKYNLFRVKFSELNLSFFIFLPPKKIYSRCDNIYTYKADVVISIYNGCIFENNAQGHYKVVQKIWKYIAVTKIFPTILKTIIIFFNIFIISFQRKAEKGLISVGYPNKDCKFCFSMISLYTF